MHRLPILFFACFFLLAFASLPVRQAAGDDRIHDPSRILREDGRYYTFYTGGGINSKYSYDLETWINGPDIFASPPAWIDAVVPRDPQYENDFWAPSLLYYNYEYRLYYSASLFGSQTSAIGYATNTTLDFNDPSYEWVDQGMVLNSQGGYPYNAIDPSVFVDQDDRMWMTFGSYSNGIYITELDPADGKPISSQPELDSTNIARHPTSSAIEAPYLHYQGGYYYLFANWGACCQGVDSTYEIRVGRSESPTGPFYDRELVPQDMLDGGGTLFLGTEGDRIGPGHMGIYSERGAQYYGYHYYDGASGGTARYEVERLTWTSSGWPIAYSVLLGGDLNDDDVIDPADWAIFQANHLIDLSMYDLSEQASRGDLDGDGDNDYDDFRLFKDYYDAYYGAGAFATMLAAVPEPTTLTLFLTGLAAIAVRRRRR